MIGSALATEGSSSDMAYFVCARLTRAGQERAGQMIAEGFRNNRSRAMQDFMG